MHIAHFIHRYPPALGGSEQYFARLGAYLVANGEQVDVWTTDALDLEAFWSRKGRTLSPRRTGGVSPLFPESENPTVTENRGLTPPARLDRFPIAHWPGRRYLLKLLSFIPSPSLQRLVLPCNPISPSMWRASARYDGPLHAVHASAFPYAFPITCGLRLARRRGVPFFLTPFLHLGDSRTRRQYTSAALRSLLEAADRIFVQTPTEFDAVEECGISQEKIVLQGLGVDASECTGGLRGDARASWKIDEETVVIGHLANQSEEKGTCDLLRAAQILWERGLNFRLVLAGPTMSNFRRFWAEFPLKGRVVQLGVLDEATKRDFYAGIDVFALPSRCDSFGLVLPEAWANRVPNLAYRAGGVADVIRHRCDGLLAPCGDVAALAEFLGELALDADLRRGLGEAGFARIDRDFCWDDKLAIVRRELRALTGEPRENNVEEAAFADH